MTELPARPHPLSDEQLERYARHIVLREVGGPGQARLSAARVLVIGAGGLGSPLILYLAAAGIGTIGVADFDTVSLSNLQRLYENVPRLWVAHVFSDRVATRLVRNVHGDSSGVRGAAWLWPGR